MKALSVFGVMLLGLVSVAGTLLFFYQRTLIYPAPDMTVPNELPPGVEKIELTNSYGYLIHGAEGKSTQKPTIIFTHGNGEIAYLWLDAFSELVAEGVSIFLVEYPGYGGAQSKPSYHNIRKTMLSAYDVLSKRDDIDSARLIAFGRSIGGGAVTLLAEERPLAAIGLESTFTTLAALVAEKGYPSFLLRDRYDNISVLKQLSVPVFLVHGKDDTLIPASHSEALHAATNNSTLVIKPCHHNNCPRPWLELLEFLKRHRIIDE